MAIRTIINFLGIKVLCRVNIHAAWWKVIVPIFALIAIRFRGANLTARGCFAPFPRLRSGDR